MRTKFHYLKIKIKSLAAEARMIRQEEQKVKRFYRNAKTIEHHREHTATFWGLRCHRKFDVRREARAAQLAYAYLRGIPLKTVESKVHDQCKQLSVLRRARDIAEKYGYGFDKEKFEAWSEAKKTEKSVRQKIIAMVT